MCRFFFLGEAPVVAMVMLMVWWKVKADIAVGEDLGVDLETALKVQGRGR